MQNINAFHFLYRFNKRSCETQLAREVEDSSLGTNETVSNKTVQIHESTNKSLSGVNIPQGENECPNNISRHEYFTGKTIVNPYNYTTILMPNNSHCTDSTMII